MRKSVKGKKVGEEAWIGDSGRKEKEKREKSCKRSVTGVRKI